MGGGGKDILAAAKDELVIKGGHYSYYDIACIANGCRYNSYCNCGVLIMNLKALREYENFFQVSTKWLRQHLLSAGAADQDALNSLLKNSIKIIDGKFNRQLWGSNDDLSCSIIHTNKRKSWQHFPAMYADFLYWKMYIRSAWGENVTCEELLDTLANIKEKNSSSVCSHSFRQCVKRLGVLIVNKFVKNPIHNLKFIVNVICQRLRYKFSD